MQIFINGSHIRTIWFLNDALNGKVTEYYNVPTNEWLYVNNQNGICEIAIDSSGKISIWINHVKIKEL